MYLTARSWFIVCSVIAALFAVFTMKVYALPGPNDDDSADTGAYIDDGAAVEDAPELDGDGETEVAAPTPLEDATETIGESPRPARDWEWTTYEYQPVDLGIETELSVLAEIRDTLNLFMALVVFGVSAMVVRFIIRSSLTVFTRNTGL